MLISLVYIVGGLISGVLSVCFIAWAVLNSKPFLLTLAHIFLGLLWFMASVMLYVAGMFRLDR